ncbi:hypothetical protein [Salinibacterium sp. ZJ77]|uniref:hypothetical protein n=1 Tax=Salinibacterium sp. ZJ77 TaxID=2708337 RepID=UPI00141F1764|nr:hypothetical protein [Salinibacterium sp. ZJ77]
MAFEADPSVVWASLTTVLLVGALVASCLMAHRSGAVIPNIPAVMGLTGRVIALGRDPRARLANGVLVPVSPEPGTAPLEPDARIVITGFERGRALVVAAPEHLEGPHATS